MKKNIFIYLLIIFSLILTSCSSKTNNQAMQKDAADKAFEESIDLKGINSGKKSEEEQGKKIIMNSVALANIAAKLDIKLAGVPTTRLGKMPERYKHIYQIGIAMNPNMEVVKTINPTILYSPDSLKDWLDEGLEKHKIPHKYVNLRSVDSLYSVTKELATEFKKLEKYNILKEEKEKFFIEYNKKISNKTKPKVLVLMGLPASYIAATKNSYVGNLIELAGAENIITSDKEFEQVNLEYILGKNPDYILRTAHAIPEVVNQMFEEEFKNNSAWRHFDAVKNNKVIDLNSKIFGMTASFDYTDALEDLEKIFYK
ncbi:heme ABC transporter substrate-binding protein IsdE [Gemella sp. zg-1178]|uniref:heme ABC transporter substrate-binding protein IsdE n=1 Tax=Gemella sp. zg-1178 TaxID=2840372 RepID=UPI001C03A5D5|nr:heme ABC transporter substrate-binding protein IsdE [Gemella sp. zg-1178]MBU0279271.1 heme ABC transporter substrate-binding protein IsdE [Gemella sp. zg-1178]